MKNYKIDWDGKFIQFVEIIIDIVIVVGVYVASVMLISNHTLLELFQGGIITRDFIITCSILGLGVMITFRIYRVSITKRGFISSMFRISISLAIVFIVLIIYSFIFYTYSLPKAPLGVMLFFQLIILAIVKGISYLILKRINIKTCLVFGPKDEVNNLSKKIFFDDNKFIILKYLVYDDFDDKLTEKVFDYINGVDYVYLTANLSIEKKDKIISYCFKIRKRFYIVPRLYELSLRNANVAQAGDTLLYHINGLDLSLEERFLKRTCDIIVSIITLLIFGPLMLIIALIIKFYDKGPVFFRQERITKDNKRFLLYKFRSMIPNAEENTGPIQASENDQRITPIGKFIRKTRIDELPQVINVLKGDMSIVGPRALRVEEVEDFIKKNPEFSYRSNVKAGITGYAQTMGSYTTSFTDKLKFDIFYITNYSLLNDFIILLHTLRSVFDPDSSKGLSEDLSLEESLEAQGFFIFRTTEDFIKIVIQR